MVRIKSVSSEGTYWLVNGWPRHKKFWSKKPDSSTLFVSMGSAKASLTKLLKAMPGDYDDDLFTFEEVDNG